MNLDKGWVVLRTTRLIIAIVVMVGLSSAIGPVAGECVDSQVEPADAECDPRCLARPVFLTASGTMDEMLTELAIFHKTVKWKNWYGTARFQIPGIGIYFQSIDQRLLFILPRANEYWPFFFAWLNDHRINIGCCQCDQPPLDEVQHSLYYSSHAPFIRCEIYDDTAAYILLTKVDNVEEDNLLEWGKVYTIEIADSSFPEVAGWDMSRLAGNVLASWSTPLQQAEQKHGIKHVPKAAWLVFSGEEVTGSLIPALNHITSTHSRPANEDYFVVHKDLDLDVEGSYLGVEEYYAWFPASDSGIYRILFHSGRHDEKRISPEMQEVIAEIARWSVAHVGVFSLKESGWLLLLFKGHK